MATTLDELIKKGMALPSESRAELADLLVQSLDAQGLGDIDRLWIGEAKRRRDEVRSGQVETVPGESATRKVRESLSDDGGAAAGENEPAHRR